MRYCPQSPHATVKWSHEGRCVIGGSAIDKKSACSRDTASRTSRPAILPSFQSVLTMASTRLGTDSGIESRSRIESCLEEM